MSYQIKNIIGLLCKLLNLLYETKLKSEHFRLAKFNKTDENTVEVLWKSLCTILKQNKECIQAKFISLNYRRKEFFCMLSTENNYESRELLLALVFLLSVKIEKDLEETLNNCNYFENFYLHKSKLTGHKPFIIKNLKDQDLKNYEMWLQGKIFTNNRMTLEYQEQTDKIQKKFNKQIGIKAHNPLTVYEILALKNKTIGTLFLDDTENFINILTAYTEWIKKEKLFWKWMETVMDEAKKSL